MKRLLDEKEVSARSYYFLLDWNERDEHKFMIEHFKKNRLCDLVIDEYLSLFLYASLNEFNRQCGSSEQN